MRSYQILDEDGQPVGFGCGHRPPTDRDLAMVHQFAEQLFVRKTGLVLEPVQCRCPHGEDWHSAGGCEARGCACEVEPR